MATRRHHLAYIDSLTRGKGHKGPSVIGGIILSPEGLKICTFLSPIDFATKYEAKYIIAINIINKALAYNIPNLVIFTDCKLLVNQFYKRSRITKPHLKAYCKTLQGLQSNFQSLVLTHIDPSLNYPTRDLVALKFYE